MGKFSEKVSNNQAGALLYGITPPKKSTEEEKMLALAARRTERINSLGVDALVVYDIQDESTRNGEARPFEYFPTHDPLTYTDRYQQEITCEKIIYQVVGKYEKGEFSRRLAGAHRSRYLSVFVGAASKDQPARIRLPEAYELWGKAPEKSLLGGVVIPERHNSKNNEHVRILEKQASGCSFFISQCICNIEMVKDFISDYCFAVDDQGLERKYFVFTLSICGTVETLRLMNWLGINIPRWMQNDLVRSRDIIQESISQNLKVVAELKEYCTEKHLSYGFNVESISPKKSEVEATVALLSEIKKIL